MCHSVCPPIHSRDPQQLILAERGAEQLHADRKWLFPACEAAGQTQPRDAGDIARHGEDVTEIHLKRIAGLLADLESGDWRSGAEDGVALLEGFVEVVLDQAAHFQCAGVIGVVVAAGKGVGSDHDSALHFFPEALGAGLAVDGDQATAAGLGQGFCPIDETSLEGVGIEAREHSPERVDRGNTVGQDQKSLEPRQIAFAIGHHFRPVDGFAEHRQDGDAQNISQ